MDDELRQKILSLLDQHRIMTLATLRPDAWPQATTVGYANDDLTGPEMGLGMFGDSLTTASSKIYVISLHRSIFIT